MGSFWQKIAVNLKKKGKSLFLRLNYAFSSPAFLLIFIFWITSFAFSSFSYASINIPSEKSIKSVGKVILQGQEQKISKRKSKKTNIIVTKKQQSHKKQWGRVKRVHFQRINHRTPVREQLKQQKRQKFVKFFLSPTINWFVHLSENMQKQSSSATLEEVVFKVSSMFQKSSKMVQARKQNFRRSVKKEAKDIAESPLKEKRRQKTKFFFNRDEGRMVLLSSINIEEQQNSEYNIRGRKNLSEKPKKQAVNALKGRGLREWKTRNRRIAYFTKSFRESRKFLRTDPRGSYRSSNGTVKLLKARSLSTDIFSLGKLKLTLSLLRQRENRLSTRLLSDISANHFFTLMPTSALEPPLSYTSGVKRKEKRTFFIFFGILKRELHRRLRLL